MNWNDDRLFNGVKVSKPEWMLRKVQAHLGKGEYRLSQRGVPILEVHSNEGMEFNISYFGKGRFFRVFPIGLQHEKFDLKLWYDVVNYFRPELAKAQ